MCGFCCWLLLYFDVSGHVNVKEIHRRPWEIRGTGTSLVYLLGAISEWMHVQHVHLYKNINVVGEYNCQTTKVSEKCKSI